MPATPAWALQFPRRMGLEISSPRQKRPTIDYPNQHRSRGDGHHHSNRGAADEQQRARCESGLRVGRPAVASGSVRSAFGGPRWDPSASVAVGGRSGAARCQPVHQPIAARATRAWKEGLNSHDSRTLGTCRILKSPMVFSARSRTQPIGWQGIIPMSVSKHNEERIR